MEKILKKALFSHFLSLQQCDSDISLCDGASPVCLHLMTTDVCTSTVPRVEGAIVATYGLPAFTEYPNHAH